MVTKYNYSFDWRRFVVLMLPFHLRVKGIKALFAPAFKVLQEAILSPFSLAKDNDNFKVTHNSQVIYLQLALNKRFKSSLSRVHFRLGDIGEDLEIMHAYNETDSDRVLYAKDLSFGDNANSSEHFYAVNAVKKNNVNSFVVYVPSDLYHTKLNEIKQFVNTYRMVTRVPLYEPTNS